MNIFDLFMPTDHNRLNKLQSYSLPSDKYINLTLGASGTTYAAPANGYLVLDKNSSGAGQFTNISNNTIGLTAQQLSTATAQGLPCFLVCKKGDSLAISYSAGGSLVRFRFIYAVGSAPQT